MADELGGTNYTIGTDRDKRPDQSAVFFRSKLVVGLTASAVIGHFIAGIAQTQEPGRAWVKGTFVPAVVVDTSVNSKNYVSDREEQFSGSGKVFHGTPGPVLATIFRSIVSTATVEPIRGDAVLFGQQPVSADRIHRVTQFGWQQPSFSGEAALFGQFPPPLTTLFRPIAFTAEIRAFDGTAVLSGQQPPGADTIFRRAQFASEQPNYVGIGYLFGQQPPAADVIYRPALFTAEQPSNPGTARLFGQFPPTIAEIFRPIAFTGEVRAFDGQAYVFHQPPASAISNPQQAVFVIAPNEPQINLSAVLSGHRLAFDVPEFIDLPPPGRTISISIQFRSITVETPSRKLDS